MNRRDFLHLTAASLLTAKAAAQTPRTQMGIATTCYLTAWRPKDTIEFLEHARGLGAAGIQAPLTSSDPGYIRRFRSLAESYGMYYESMVPLPKNGDTATFEKSLQNAKEAGAIAARTQCLGSRRYETYHSLADWQRFVETSNSALQQAVPVAERVRLPLALENHKDWTADELVSLLKAHSSEYLGTCLDFGNNLALLDDPQEVIERLAPYAVAVHLKDMAMEPAPDGFLLSEVVLGEGILDLRKAIAVVRKARPATRMTLEMITRDPLRVPCLTDDYWVTFPNRGGRDLARTLRLVRETSQEYRRLPRVMQQSPAALLRLEDENVRNCLRRADAFFL